MATKDKALVIVESPAKAKTINKYLGPGFEVKASMGHVRDLPSKGLNVDIENRFDPTYDIMPGKKRTVISLKAAAKKCDRLYLATDLDREGEAIAWHLAQILNIPEDKTYRVIFNAITKTTIQEAFKEPGRLDMHKVMAQQARRILDRIVGYQISPLLWKKVTRGLSAGRVQSVAVKIVVEKEREIRAFKAEEYWLIPGIFTTDLQSSKQQLWLDYVEANTVDGKGPTHAEQSQWLTKHNAFKAELYKVGPDKFKASNEEEAQRIFKALDQAKFEISDIQTKESLSRPSPPFITSTVQQAASNRMGFAAKRTMRVAQQLYEGVDLGTRGSVGLITYMRTDSTHLSQEALNSVRDYIGKAFGGEYLPEKAKRYAAGKDAQAAHEAIRPTDVSLAPDEIESFLTEEQFKLYNLIWRRFVASQMQPARWNVTTLDIKADTDIGPCFYRTNGRILVFDGCTRVWTVSSAEQQLPTVAVGQSLLPVDIKAEQHFTKAPPRYTEASLVKALEKEGIGRPSTYASIISTIQDRDYVKQKERKFYATDLGEVVTDKLSEFFPKIMDISFTRFMESQLDKIEEQHLDWVGILNEFYGPFKQNLETAQEEMVHAKAETQPSDYTCPECKQAMVYRFGKNGRFLSCSAYPDCKFACPCDDEGKMLEQVVTEHKCPKCSKPMIHKKGRFGEFLGCSDYPECKTTQKIDKEGNILPPKPPAEPSGVKCHKCKTGELVIRQSKRGPFLGCNKFPRCRTIVSMKQIDHLKELQEAGKWPPDSLEKADELLGRTKKKKTTKKTAKKKVAKKTAKKVKADTAAPF
jgi:DNA topoisomerase I